nr:MAG TPA: hypothetical protein [Bacteriophage sp.]
MCTYLSAVLLSILYVKSVYLSNCKNRPVLPTLNGFK